MKRFACDTQEERDLPDSEVVHIIEDDSDVRHALTFALEAAGLSVRMHESAVAFLDAGPSTEAGCIVTDIRMPGMDGLELQRKLRAERNDTPVIVVTGVFDLALTIEVMKAGAFEFFEKPFDNDGLVEAIRTAMDGRHGRRRRWRHLSAVRRHLEQLSQRERHVLDGLAAGKLNSTIADDLGLSVRAVEECRASILAKMRAPDLTALIRMVLADEAAEVSAN
jgi:two-component system, LuxR family, response regulator FixJ